MINAHDFTTSRYVNIFKLLMYYTLMAYAGVVLVYRRKILLQLRDNKPTITSPNCWGTFGGGIEIGENPEQAAKREIQEELGLKIESLKLLLETEFNGEGIHIFIQELENISSLQLHEGQAMKFFSKEEILKLKNTVPGLKELMRVYL